MTNKKEEGSSFSKILADKIKKATALSNEIRLRIVLSIFSTEILKIGHSLTFSQLERMLNIGKQDLAYHLNVLKEVHIVDKEDRAEGDKKKTYYKISTEGVKLLELLGVSGNKVEELSRELGIIS